MTIEVQVKYFAVLRELVGCAEETISCPARSDVAALLALLEQRHDALAGQLGKVAVALDHEYATTASPLYEGAEVALLPPVAGGVPVPEERQQDTHFQVLDEPLSLDAVVALVDHEAGGAIATFTGMVRRQSQGRTVARLDYEAYGPMAVKELRKIGAKLQEEWPQARIAIHHRVGSLEVGEVAVTIAVCTPHRQAAFDACSAAIERLKETVPIWKKEFFTDGSTWVGWGP